MNLRACLHQSGGPLVGEVRCGGSPHLSCKRDQIKIKFGFSPQEFNSSWVLLQLTESEKERKFPSGSRLGSTCKRKQ